MFEWIVSRGSMEEAHAKRDCGHMQWLWDIAEHSEVCLAADGPTAKARHWLRASTSLTSDILARPIADSCRKPSFFVVKHFLRLSVGSLATQHPSDVNSAFEF
jgi:hypothetical protein